MASGGIQVSEVSSPIKADWPKHLRHAYADIGIVEWEMRGKTKVPNAALVARIRKATGAEINTIRVPWCAFWSGTTLEESGIPSTKSGMARSYLKWGEEIDLGDARPGDICVTWRGKYDDGVTGHVFYYLGRRGSNILGLGGNQGDSVSIQEFTPKRLLGVRRYRPATKSRTVRAALGAFGSETTGQIADVAIPSPKAPDPVGVLETGNQVKSVLEPLSSIKPSIMVACTVLSLALIGLAAYYRYRDHKSGRNV